VFVPQTAGWGLGQDLAAVTRGVPESLVHLIDSHLVRLAPAEQELLSVASVAGSVFSAAALAAGLDRPLEDVEAWCDRLAQRGQFLRALGATAWPDGTVTTRYRFLHDLYHEVLYERVAMSRRMRWHRQIGARLEAGYGPQVREMAAELAEHFVRGQDPQRAVLYLQQAAENAARRYAPQEVIDLLQRALGLLGTFPETPERLQHEVTLQTRLGTAFMALKGFASPEVAQVYARARELCQQLGDTPLLFPVLWGGVGLSCGPYRFTPGAAPRGPASDPGPTGSRPSAPGASPPRPGADVVLAGGVCPGVYPPGAEPGTRGSPAAPRRDPRLWAR
jgi:hypothetical protein